MALRASANRSVFVGLTDCVALFTTGSGCGMPFGKDKRIRRPLGPTWLKLFAKGNLFGSEALFSLHCCPAGSGVATAKELLIDPFMTGATVASRQVSTDNESVVIDFLLTRGRLMAIQAIDAFLRMSGHLIFVNDRVLETRMALSALPGSANKVGCRLCGLDTGTLAMDQERRQDESKCKDDSQKY
jgi:hypothetical protein